MLLYQAMIINNKHTTLEESLRHYNQIVRESRSPNTARSYKQSIEKFSEMLIEHGIDLNTSLTNNLKEEYVLHYIQKLRDYAPATEQLYLTAVVGYYEFLSSEYDTEINLTRVRTIIKRRQRKVAQKLPQFPRENIETIIRIVLNTQPTPNDDKRSILRLYRDKAFIVTLADTGLRISEACSLTRGQYDSNERQAIVVIKGGQESIVRFSERAHNTITHYLNLRSIQDGTSGKALTSLPLFARHDLGSSNKTLPIKSMGARNIINKWVTTALGSDHIGTITPHSFRHYFVTIVLKASQGNLKLAQKLARHKSITITQRYAHLTDDDLDRSYNDIFND
ncbi:MAG TPA: hypothetical protein DGM69_04760 [Chloroflexi bacterium]|nr:hypothetical protein [Chloroflexota bacterium]